MLIDGTHHRSAKPYIGSLVESALVVSVLPDGFHQGIGVVLQDAAADDEGGDLLLLTVLPVDVLFDIRVIEVQSDHLGCSPSRSS